MEFLIWMAIGVALMAVELVVPGGILGLIGYCAFLWGVYVALGEGTVALYAVLGLTALLIVIIIVFFNPVSYTHLDVYKRQIIDNSYRIDAGIRHNF